MLRIVKPNEANKHLAMHEYCLKHAMRAWNNRNMPAYLVHIKDARKAWTWYIASLPLVKY